MRGHRKEMIGADSAVANRRVDIFDMVTVVRKFVDESRGHKW